MEPDDDKKDQELSSPEPAAQPEEKEQQPPTPPEEKEETKTRSTKLACTLEIYGDATMRWGTGTVTLCKLSGGLRLLLASQTSDEAKTMRVLELFLDSAAEWAFSSLVTSLSFAPDGVLEVEADGAARLITTKAGLEVEEDRWTILGLPMGLPWISRG